MPEFNSPLGKKSLAPGESRRILTVEDESLDIPEPPADIFAQLQNQPGVPIELTAEQFNQMQSRRQVAVQSQKRVSTDARTRIDVLTGIGRLTTEVVLEGHKFTLQSLKSKQLRESVIAAAQIQTPSEVMFEMRSQTLARSLIKIDDHPVAMVLGSSGVEAVLSFLEESEDHIVNMLYTEYSKMMKEIETKYAVKTKEDAQEVMAEIKKS